MRMRIHTAFVVVAAAHTLPLAETHEHKHTQTHEHTQ